MIETASHKLAALLRVCALGTPVRIIFLSFRLCKPYRAVESFMYGRCRRAISWQEEYADLSFLNSPFRRLFYVLPDSYNVGHLSIRCYSDRLHKELIATSCVRRWVLFHCLKKDCTICHQFAEPFRRNGYSHLELQHRYQARFDRNWGAHSIY